MKKAELFQRHRNITLALAKRCPNHMAHVLHGEWLICGSMGLNDKEDPELQLIRYVLDFAKQYYGKKEKTEKQDSKI